MDHNFKFTYNTFFDIPKNATLENHSGPFIFTDGI